MSSLDVSGSMSNDPQAARSFRTLVVASVVIAFLSLATAPLWCFFNDMHDYWVPWQLGTEAVRPWNAYTVKGCNYLPVCLYALGAMEGLREALSLEPMGRLNWVLIKLPNILAHVGGAFAVYAVAKPLVGKARASAMGLAWVLSAGFFVNAALWGQWDVIFSLAVVLGVLELARRRFTLAGVWIGIALATKVQAVFAVPAVGVYLLLACTWKDTAKAVAGGVLAMVLAFAPMAMGGRLHESVGVYTASVDTFPARSLNAWNPWTLLNGVEVRLLHKPKDEVTSDKRLVVPAVSRSFTYKRLGQLLFGTYLLAVLIVLARRRDVRTLLLAVPMSGLAMFMLATQMHERYGLPHAAAMVPWVLMGRPFRMHYVYWTLSTAINQAAVCAMESMPLNVFQAIGGIGSVLNLALFLHASWLYFRPAPPSAPAFASHTE